MSTFMQDPAFLAELVEQASIAGHNGPQGAWDEMVEEIQEEWRAEMRRALIAVIPAIAARAREEALMKACVLAEHQWRELSRLGYSREADAVEEVLLELQELRAMPTPPQPAPAGPTFEQLVERVGELPQTGLASAEPDPIPSSATHSYVDDDAVDSAEPDEAVLTEEERTEIRALLNDDACGDIYWQPVVATVNRIIAQRLAARRGT